MTPNPDTPPCTHEQVDTPGWDTAIRCSCGERCTNYMRFYRHRGDAYAAEVAALRAALAQRGGDLS